MLKSNATLLCKHFLWEPGTRVHINACWNTKDRVIVTLPQTEGAPSGRWVLPAKCVKADKGVRLKIEKDPCWEALHEDRR